MALVLDAKKSQALRIVETFIASIIFMTASCPLHHLKSYVGNGKMLPKICPAQKNNYITTFNKVM